MRSMKHMNAIGVIIRHPPANEYLDSSDPIATIEEAVEHLIRNGGVLWEFPVFPKGTLIKPFSHAKETKVVFFAKFPERKVTHIARVHASGRRDQFFEVDGIEKYVLPSFRSKWRDLADAQRTYSFLLDRIWKLKEMEQFPVTDLVMVLGGKNVNASDRLHRPRPVVIPREFQSILMD